MRIEVLWENVKKIWRKGRGYTLTELLEDEVDEKRAVFEKDGKKALAIAIDGKLRVKFLREIKEVLEGSNYQMATIASVGRATWYAEEEAEEAEEEMGKKIEIISEDHPLVYILDHWLVPEHEVLPEEEAQEVVEKFTKGNKMKLPKITVKDPVARILMAKPGDIIKITRKVPSKEEAIAQYGKNVGTDAYEKLKATCPAGEETYYRLVVKEEREELF